MKAFSRSLLLALTALSALQLGASSQPDETGKPAKNIQLSIQLDGLEETAGHVLIAVYTSPETFLRQPFRALALTPDSLLKAPARFTLPADSLYAVSLFHDANDNRRHDTNAMGIPVERYGFSRDAQGVMGPPTFEACALRLSSDSTILIHLR